VLVGCGGTGQVRPAGYDIGCMPSAATCTRWARPGQSAGTWRPPRRWRVLLVCVAIAVLKYRLYAAEALWPR